MEKKQDGIFISNVFLESIIKTLVDYCNKCQPCTNDRCINCKIDEVIDDLKFVIEFAGEYDD